jgi:hypothetical protein
MQSSACVQDCQVAIDRAIPQGPLHDFYEALLAKGRKSTIARLTLARKIAAITLICRFRGDDTPCAGWWYRAGPAFPRSVRN